MSYTVIISVITPPERGLVETVKSIRRYATERGARLYCFKNFKPHRSDWTLFFRVEANGDETYARVKPN